MRMPPGPSLAEINVTARSSAMVDFRLFSPDTLRAMRGEIGQRLAKARRGGFEGVDMLTSIRAAIVTASVENTLDAKGGPK
jgi:hypothetical protein